MLQHNKDIHLDPMDNGTLHRLIAATWNQWRCRGMAWCREAEIVDRAGLAAVWQVLGPKHPIPGATARDYYEALRNVEPVS